MIAIRVELLGGSYHATDHTLRSSEWPPHPDRVYQALVATLHVNGNLQSQRDALRLIESAKWLINASEAKSRPRMTQYVPRNEDQGGGRGSYNPVLTTTRMKERHLPVSEPVDPVVYYLLETDTNVDVAELTRLVECVGRLGRSHVVMTVIDATVKPNWEPADSGGEILLRVPYSGRLSDLESAFAAKVRPGIRWCSYRRCGQQQVTSLPEGEFSDLIVLASSGSGVGSSRTAPLLEAARSSVLSLCADPLPAWLSGHAADGSPLADSHLGLAPIVFSGIRGDGRIMGIGLLIPKRVNPIAGRAVLQPVVETGLTLAGQAWHVGNSRAMTTEPATWTRPERRWVSVTPLEIRRRDRRPAVEIVTEWAERAGMSAPSLARLRPEPFVNGPIHASRYARGKHPRMRMHALLEWDKPIAGPVALGMGRFRGFGFMRPIRDGEVFDET